MKRGTSYFVELCSWAAMLLLLGLAGVFFALLSGRILPDDAIRFLLLDQLLRLLQIIQMIKQHLYSHCQFLYEYHKHLIHRL